LLTDTIELCSVLALISHCIDTCACRLSFDEALNKFISIEGMCMTYGN